MSNQPSQAFNEIISAVKEACGRCAAKPVHVLSVCEGRPYCVAMSRTEAEAWMGSQPHSIIKNMVTHVDLDIYCWQTKDERFLIEGDLCIL